MTFALADLDQYKQSAFPKGYPPNYRIFYAPVDNLKSVLTTMLQLAQNSLVIAMFGFDDDGLAQIIRDKLSSEHVYVQLTLDKTQAGGVHEKSLLDKMNYPASSIAIGSSEHGRIIHTKMAIIDGVYTIGGSTNWSDAAEKLQDNELTVIEDPYIAAEATARVSRLHATVLAKTGNAA